MSDPRGAMCKEKSISHSVFIKGLESGCLRQFALSSPFHSDHYFFCPANSHTETTKKGSWKVKEMQKMTVFVCCTDILSCNYDKQNYKEAQVFCLKITSVPCMVLSTGCLPFYFIFLFLMYFAVIVFTIA